MTYDYVIGMDVGKYFHHACVLDIDGTQVLSKRCLLYTSDACRRAI